MAERDTDLPPLDDNDRPDVESADADFDAAFNEFSGSEDDAGTNDDDNTETQADADKDPAATAETNEEDPNPLWLNATPEQVAAYKDATKGQQSWDRDRKSVGGLSRALQESRSQTAALQARLEQQDVKPAADPAEEDADADPEADPKKGWADFEGDYPEIGEPVDARFAALEAKMDMVTGKVDTFDGAFADLSGERQIAFIDEQEAQILAVHPDYSAIRGSDEFMGWFENAPKYVRDVVEKNADYTLDGKEVAHIVSTFKAEMAEQGLDLPIYTPTDEADAGDEGDPQPTPLEAQRQRRLNSSTDIPSKTGAAGDGPGNSFDNAFDHFQRKSDELAGRKTA